MNQIARRIRRTFAVVRSSFVILRSCGLRVFAQKLAHQLYGRTYFLVGEGRELADESNRPTSDFRCVVSKATPEEVEELFRGIETESSEGRYQLLVRKWYHQRGFGDCYITRSLDTGEICVARWLVTPEHIRRLGWQDRFPLEEDECMMENVYTFERYRRMGARTASGESMRQIAIALGFKRAKGYTDERNTPQLQASVKSEGKKSARILERHILFHVSRKVVERFDPPILTSVLLERQKRGQKK